MKNDKMFHLCNPKGGMILLTDLQITLPDSNLCTRDSETSGLCSCLHMLWVTPAHRTEHLLCSRVTLQEAGLDCSHFV